MRWRLLASSSFVIKTGEERKHRFSYNPRLPNLQCTNENEFSENARIEKYFPASRWQRKRLRKKYWRLSTYLYSKTLIKIAINDCHRYHPPCKQPNIFNHKAPVPKRDIFDSTVCSASNQDGSDAAYQNEKYLTTRTCKGVFRGVRMFASYTTRAEGSQTPLLLKLLINMIRPLSHVRAVVVFWSLLSNFVLCSKERGWLRWQAWKSAITLGVGWIKFRWVKPPNIFFYVRLSRRSTELSILRYDIKDIRNPWIAKIHKFT